MRLFVKGPQKRQQTDDFDRVLVLAEKYAAKRSELDAEYALGELSFACHTLGRSVKTDEAARLFAATEKLIVQHGRGDVDWDAYRDICAAYPSATILWRKHAEKFNLNDAGAIEKIDKLTPPDIARLNVTSQSGRIMIGPADDVGLHPRAHYRTKTASVTFVIDDCIGARGDIEKHVNDTYPLGGDVPLKPEHFTHNVSKRAIYTVFMDAAEAFFATKDITPKTQPQIKPE